jgi:integrase
MKVNTAIILDTRKALKDGKYPVKLRVTYNRTQKYYAANANLSQTEFDKVMEAKAKGNFKTLKLKLSILEQKANTIISSLSTFDFNTFKKKLYSDESVNDDVYAHFKNKIASLNKDGQIGTASNYLSSMNSLMRFRKKLSFSDVNPEFLKFYEKYLLGAGKSITTVGIYLRPLRSIINQAIQEGSLSKDYNYPFGTKSKLKYQIPTGKNIKKALQLSEIEMLFNYSASPNTWEERALDFWIFSYLANGMNMTDIAHLKYNDIDGEYIRFVRAKTKNTNQVTSPITVPVSEDLKRIIERWGNEDNSLANYIFPILKPGDTPVKNRANIQQFTKMVNKYMKTISRKLGIKKPCTTYFARHSFSTVLKRAGANIQFISEALGHNSINTTLSYLDSIEDDTKKEMAKALTAFK